MIKYISSYLFLFIASSLLTTTNETVYGVWNTTAGSNSLLSSCCISSGCYFTGEEPQMAFDQLNSTKYTSFGVCNNLQVGPACGLNTGLYLTLQRGLSLLRTVRFSTGTDISERDVLTVTIEGSSESSTALMYGSSWSLIYNGSSGLENVTTRSTFGPTQLLSNNYMWCNSYRILSTSKRGNASSAHYSEIELFGYLF